MNPPQPPLFNWVSQDQFRNLFFGVRDTLNPGTLGVLGASHEMGYVGTGGFAGQYGDKFIYGEDHGDLKAWGFSCVNAGGLNHGSWMMTNLEFSDGGPLKRDVFAYGTNLINYILTGELGQGSDGGLAAGELWTKVMGSFFNYFNHLDQADPKAGDAGTALWPPAISAR